MSEHTPEPWEAIGGEINTLMKPSALVAWVAGSAGGGTIVFLHPVVGGLEFQCQRDGCFFRRVYATKQGALQGISEHLLAEHRVRAVWRDPPKEMRS